MSQPLVIYHGPRCMDGRAAAYALWLYYDGHIELYPMNFDEIVTDNFVANCANRMVYLVDFNLPIKDLRRILEVAIEVTVWDHHKTFHDNLLEDPLDDPKFSYAYEPDQSGCVITWRKLFMTEPPLIYRFIEDRDLWKFELEQTKEIVAALFYDNPSVEAFGDYAALKEFDRLYTIGCILLSEQERTCRGIISTTHRKILLCGKEFDLYNCPSKYVSELAEIARNKGVTHVATYFDSRSSRVFSLRCNTEDISGIAKSFGGGGHAHACGFNVTREHFLARI